MPQPMLYASDKIDRSYQDTRTSSFILSDIKRSLAGPCVLYLFFIASNSDFVYLILNCIISFVLKK